MQIAHCILHTSECENTWRTYARKISGIYSTEICDLENNQSKLFVFKLQRELYLCDFLKTHTDESPDDNATLSVMVSIQCPLHLFLCIPGPQSRAGFLFMQMICPSRTGALHGNQDLSVFPAA